MPKNMANTTGVTIAASTAEAPRSSDPWTSPIGQFHNASAFRPPHGLQLVLGIGSIHITVDSLTMLPLKKNPIPECAYFT